MSDGLPRCHGAVARERGAWRARVEVKTVQHVQEDAQKHRAHHPTNQNPANHHTTPMLAEQRQRVRAPPATAEEHYAQGVRHSCRQEHALAHHCYAAACALDPRHAAARCNLGQTLSLLGHFCQAASQFRKAIEVDPNLAAAQLNLSHALRNAGEPEAAVEAASAAVGLVMRSRSGGTPAHKAHTAGGVSHAQAHAALARALSLADRFDDAFESARIAARYDAAFAPLRLQLVETALERGLKPKPQDVWIASFPKSGTTWVQQIVCLLLEKPEEGGVQAHAPWAEAVLASGAISLRGLIEMPTPRIFKTHADAFPAAGGVKTPPAAVEPPPGSTPPPAVQTPPAVQPPPAVKPPPGVKVISIARDPRDVCVSLYHHSRAIKAISWEGSWELWTDTFLRGEAPTPALGGEGGYFEHVCRWRRAANAWPEQVLWLTYESLSIDPHTQVRRIATFLNVAAPSEAAIARIVERASFATMKRAHEAADARAAAPLRNAGHAAHYRVGRSGCWREAFSGEQREAFEAVAARFGLRLEEKGWGFVEEDS